MPAVIITDASCLILLDKIGRLDLLANVYGKLLMTPEVAQEFGHPSPDWLEVKAPENTSVQKVAQANLDPGEASSIALALENVGCLLIMDDLKGRKLAQSLGLDFTGTLGVVVEAKLSGIIPSVKEVLDEIRQTNFRLTEKLEKLALQLAGE